MPKVGGKHFPYTKAGYRAAAKAKRKKRQMTDTGYMKKKG